MALNCSPQIAKSLEGAGSRVNPWPRLFTDPSALPPSACPQYPPHPWSQEGFQRTSLQLLKTASGAARKETKEGSPPHAPSPFLREKSPSQTPSSRLSYVSLTRVTPSPLAAKESGKASLAPLLQGASCGAPVWCREGLLERFPRLSLGGPWPSYPSSGVSPEPREWCLQMTSG